MYFKRAITNEFVDVEAPGTFVGLVPQYIGASIGPGSRRGLLPLRRALGGEGHVAFFGGNDAPRPGVEGGGTYADTTRIRV